MTAHRLIRPVEVYIDREVRARFPDIVVAFRRPASMPHWYLGGEPKKGGWIRCPGADGWMRCPIRVWLVRQDRRHGGDNRAIGKLRSLGYATNELPNTLFVDIREDPDTWPLALSFVLAAAEEALKGWPRC